MAKSPSQPQQGGGTPAEPQPQQQGEQPATQPKQQGGQTLFRDWASI